MSVPEARRHDLYHGLEEVLGTDRADTLMTYLPTSESAALATRSDLTAVSALIEDVRTELHGVRTELKTELQDVRVELKTEIQGVRVELKTEIQGVRTELKTEIQQVGNDLRTEIRSVNQRLDRLFLTLAAGLVATMGAVVTALFIA